MARSSDRDGDARRSVAELFAGDGRAKRAGADVPAAKADPLAPYRDPDRVEGSIKMLMSHGQRLTKFDALLAVAKPDDRRLIDRIFACILSSVSTLDDLLSLVAFVHVRERRLCELQALAERVAEAVRTMADLAMFIQRRCNFLENPAIESAVAARLDAIEGSAEAWLGLTRFLTYQDDFTRAVAQAQLARALTAPSP